MSTFYNSRSRRQNNNYRNKHHNHYDDYNDYAYYDAQPRQQYQPQQRQNKYKYSHSNVDIQNKFYHNTIANHSKQYNQYNEHNKEYIYNKYRNYDYDYEYGYYDNDEQYQQTNHQNNTPFYDHVSRDKTRNIRDMNNWCKYVNITHSIRQAYKDNGKKKIKILDLGCGKGADLYKCRGNKKFIQKYLGIDLSSDCIVNARQKYTKILETNIIHRNASYETRRRFGVDNAYGQTANEFFDEPIFDAQFICDDMNALSLSTQHLIACNKPFQLINIQFALHNSFQSKVSLLSLFNMFNKYTASDAYFICSFVRDDIIINRLTQQNENEDGNVCYENEYQWISMKQSDFKYVENMYKKYNLLQFDANTIDDMDDVNHFDDLIGVAYRYYQRDSIEGDNGSGVEEYLIPFAVLCKLLWQYCKMRLVYKKNCSDIYSESSRAFPYKFGYSKGRELDSVKWTKDEQSVIDTYSYALFKRV